MRLSGCCGQSLPQYLLASEFTTASVLQKLLEIIGDLPSSDPSVIGQLWVDGNGFLRVSIGTTGKPIGLLLSLTYA